MRKTVLPLTLALLAGVQLYHTSPNTTTTPAALQRATAPQTSAHAQRRAVPCRSARFIDGHQVVDQLASKGGQLIEQGKTVPMAKLAAQLRRTRCQLALPAASGKTLDSPTLYATHRRSVLVVGHLAKCGDCVKWHLNPASGFVVAKGVAATNYHVVDQPGETMVVATAGGEVFPVTEVLAASKKHDVALVRFGGGDHVPPLALGSPARVGQTAHVISHPDGRLYMFTRGLVSGYYSERPPAGARDTSFMAITADYAQGSSGGPVLDAKGHVIGMVSATNTVYAGDEQRGRRDVQMVEKMCVTVAQIRALITAPEEKTQ